MKNRDQFVEELKAGLDRLNANAAKWESRGEKSRDEFLAAYRARHEQALYQLKLLEKASASAYQDVAEGANAAWRELSEAYDRAVKHFEKTSPNRRR